MQKYFKMHLYSAIFALLINNIVTKDNGLDYEYNFVVI